MSRHVKFSILVLLCSIPFYALNLFYKEGILIDLPISFLMIMVPFFIAAYFIYKDHGKSGIKNWLKEIYLYKTNKVTPLILSLIIIPFSMYLAVLLSNNKFEFGEIGLTKSIVLFGLLFIGALFEELGWTAYLTKIMRRKYSILQTGLLIGFIWGIWHLLPYISQGKSTFDIVFLILLSIFYRVIMGYIFDYSNESTLVNTLFHTTINWFPEIIKGKYTSFSFDVLALILLFAIFTFNILEIAKLKGR